MPDAITTCLNTETHEVRIKFENLVVTGMQMPEGGPGKLLILMNYFEEKGYIINPVYDSDGKISLTYATRKIKELLTTAGKILEVYTYHKVKELGWFDDVVSGVEIDRDDSSMTSVPDCILTKGFRTLLVWCSAEPGIEQDTYDRITKIMDEFGINATAVLITDTWEESSCDSAFVNAIRIKEDSMKDVETIWEPDEISDIGHTLLRVIQRGI